MQHRVSSTRGVLAAGLLSALLVFGAVGAAPAEARTHRARLLDMINDSREKQGLDPVKLNVRLSDDAHRHSRRMVRLDELFDVPNLAALLKPYHWTYGAEAVGCDRNLFRLHRMFLSDAIHRSIILSDEARRIGIGVTRVDGKSSCGRDTYWATEIFYG